MLAAQPAAMLEVNRQFGLNEDVLRALTLRIEAIEEAPSAILSRRGEERERDRGFRGPRPAGRFSSGRQRERGDDREEFRARPRDELDPSQDGPANGYAGRGPIGEIGGVGVGKIDRERSGGRAPAYRLCWSGLRRGLRPPRPR